MRGIESEERCPSCNIFKTGQRRHHARTQIKSAMTLPCTLNLPGVGLEQPLQHFEQVPFARAIFADDADAPSPAF